MLYINYNVNAHITNKYFKNNTTMSNTEILQTANKAIANGDYEGFLTFCSDDTKWIFIGDQILDGKEAVRKYMKETYLEPLKFTEDNILEDGDFVSVMGKLSLKDMNGSYTHFDYCDNWQFNNGKIVGLKAYVVEQIAPRTVPLCFTNEDTVTQLREAIVRNDLIKVNQLLQSGADVNCPNDQGLTPLMLAAGFGYTTLVELLLTYGANVLALDTVMGSTALHKAVLSGNTSIIQILLENGAFINLQSPVIGNSPLMDAVLYKQEHVVEVLLKNKARTELRNNFQETALDIARNMGTLSVIQLLEQHNQNLSKIVQTQAVIKAIKTNQIQELKKLLDQGYSLNERIPSIGNYDDDYTALGIAARDGQDHIVKLLLDYGADITLLNGIMGATPAHEAAYAGYPEVIKTLMDYKNEDSGKVMDINAQGGYNGMTALHDAVWQNNFEAVKALVRAGAALTLISHSGLTPRKLAELYQFNDIADFLLKVEKN